MLDNIVSIEYVGVKFFALNYEERIKFYDEVKLKNLIVRIPSALDLIFLKSSRMNGDDRREIKELIEANSIPLEDLESFVLSEEMEYVVMADSDIKNYVYNYSSIIHDSFGENASLAFYKKAKSRYSFIV